MISYCYVKTYAEMLYEFWRSMAEWPGPTFTPYQPLQTIASKHDDVSVRRFREPLT